jgi:hypothetical protein
VTPELRRFVLRVLKAAVANVDVVATEEDLEHLRLFVVHLQQWLR